MKAELFHEQVRTDIHDEASNRFSKFFEGAYKWEKNKSADTINKKRA